MELETVEGLSRGSLHVAKLLVYSSVLNGAKSQDLNTGASCLYIFSQGAPHRDRAADTTTEITNTHT